MPSRIGVWSVGRLLLLAAALGGTFLLFFGVALRVALRAREVQVPALAGKTINDASQTLGALGLTLKVDRGIMSEDVIDTLAELFAMRGVPKDIRSDNGPEFIAATIRRWLSQVAGSTSNRCFTR